MYKYGISFGQPSHIAPYILPLSCVGTNS